MILLKDPETEELYGAYYVDWTGYSRGNLALIGYANTHLEPPKPDSYVVDMRDHYLNLSKTEILQRFEVI